MKRTFLFVTRMTLLAALWLPLAAFPINLLEMSDKLDKADQQDFSDAVGKAKRCIQSRDFTCAEKELEKASKLTTRNEDRKTLASARQDLAGAKQRVEQERLAEERRKQAERARQSASYANGSSSTGSTVDFVLVDAEMTCGFCSVIREKLTLSGGPGLWNPGASGGALQKGYNGEIAGRYNYFIQFSQNKSCSGSVDISGQKRNVKINVYGNCSDAGTWEN